MAQTPRSEPVAEPLPADPYPDYPRGYVWFFQSWLVLFLTVICAALLMYLGTYVP